MSGVAIVGAQWGDALHEMNIFNHSHTTLPTQRMIPEAVIVNDRRN